MNKELLSCPFCGEDAHIVQGINGYTQQNSNWMYGVECDECRGAVEQTFSSEAEAIEAWNTRAERTCHVVRKEAELPKGSDDVRKKIVFNCSECDEWLGKSANYCPNCGAKVVEK